MDRTLLKHTKIKNRTMATYKMRSATTIVNGYGRPSRRSAELCAMSQENFSRFIEKGQRDLGIEDYDAASERALLRLAEQSRVVRQQNELTPMEMMMHFDI